MIQYNEYYPFGLQTANSWTRENASNNFLYNGGSELNTNSGWYETFFRGYDASLGRFLQVDPLAHMSAGQSPYNYGFNNPVLFNDPLGDKPSPAARYGQVTINTEVGDLWSQISGNPFNNGGWANAYRSIDANAAIMSTSQFLSYYGVVSDADRFNLAQRAAAESGMTREEAAAPYADQIKAFLGNGVSVEGSWVVIPNYEVISEEGSLTRLRQLWSTWIPIGGDAQQEYAEDADNPFRTFEVLHSANDSFGWDWFIETTRSTNASRSVVSNYFTQTAVIIVYNTNKKDWGTRRYGQVVDQIVRTRSLIMDAGGIHPHKELPPNISQFMNDFIQGAKDYHCGGCLSAPTLMDKYLDFILSPKDPKGSSLTPNGVHR